MGKSNYKLTEEQKRELDCMVNAFLEGLDEKLEEIPELNPWNTANDKFDMNMFQAIVWYIGDKLSNY